MCNMNILMIDAFNFPGLGLNVKLLPISVLVEVLLNEAEHLRELNGHPSKTNETINEAMGQHLVDNRDLDYVLAQGCNFHLLVCTSFV